MCKKLFIVSNPSEGVQVVKAHKRGGGNSLLPLLCCKPVWALEDLKAAVREVTVVPMQSPHAPTYHLPEMETEAPAGLKVPEGQCCKSAFFSALLSQRLERFLTLVHLNEHHHQYFNTVSTWQDSFSMGKGSTATAAPAALRPFVTLLVSSPTFLLVNPAFLIEHLL